MNAEGKLHGYKNEKQKILVRKQNSDTEDGKGDYNL